MNLEQFVPPLELCKQIPQGAFADSALVWTESNFTAIIQARYFVTERHVWQPGICPAPTFAEILAALDAIFDDCEYDVCVWNAAQPGEWGIQIVVFGRTVNHTEYGANPATAALKLWMEVNK